MSTPSEDVGYINETDISKSCDICGEGKSYGHKHRLHLYIKDTYDTSSIRCFNCDYRSNLYNYLKDYHTDIFDLYKREKKGSAFEELKIKTVKRDKPVEPVIADFDDFNETNETQTLPHLIEPIQEFTDLNVEVAEYLHNRGIVPLKEWRYAPKNTSFMFNSVKVTLNDYLIIPLTKDDKWYGFQAIAYKEKKFFVYLLKGNDGYKIWNWYNIDKSKPVYIFESVYDALSSGLDNVIASLGVSISDEKLSELKEPVFCLDNQLADDTSLTESKKYADKGYKIFIWPDGSSKFKDTNDLRKIDVPLTDIANMIKSNIYSGMTAVLKLKLL